MLNVQSVQRAMRFSLVSVSYYFFTCKNKNDEKVDIKLLGDKLKEMENRSRRNNLRIEGLKEDKKETWFVNREKVMWIFKKKNFYALRKSKRWQTTNCNH